MFVSDLIANPTVSRVAIEKRQMHSRPLATSDRKIFVCRLQGYSLKEIKIARVLRRLRTETTKPSREVRAMARTAKFKANWLRTELDSAAKDVQSWPVGMRRDFSDISADAGHTREENRIVNSTNRGTGTPKQKKKP